MNATTQLQTIEMPAAPSVCAQKGFRPLFTVGGLYSTANGVAWIMRDLAAALGRLGAPVTVCAADCVGRKSVGHIFEPPTRWVTAQGRWLGGLSLSPRLKPILRREIANADVVHNHSVWMLPNSYASRIAERLGRPVVFTAHGTLEPWALAHSGWKKRLLEMAFQKRDLQRAACIHVNSNAEASSIRAYGLKQPIAVIPNGVDASFLGSLPQRDEFERSFPETANRRIVLFMARLHRKKGLEHLVRAWARIAPEFSDWMLVIAGPDNGFEAHTRSLIEQLGLDRNVILTGNLQGQAKRQALGAADLFVLPSFSEGFSMAILEALAAGLPVLLTPGCNFPEAAVSGAAVEVEASVAGTEEGLRRLCSLKDVERQRMGWSGRGLIVSKYTWDRVAQQTLQLYRWMTRGGSAPDFVIG